MFTQFIRPAVLLLLVMTALLGVAYPLAITGIAQVAFPNQAGGSLIYQHGKPIGSSLIGQSFSEPKYFWGRPSATTPQPYNGTSSSASNFGPLNPALLDEVKANVQLLQVAGPDQRQPIPIDLVTSSASGLDPEISVAGARYQAARVASARTLPLAQVERLIATHERGRLLGVIGEPRVNVLELNLALDAMR